MESSENNQENSSKKWTSRSIGSSFQHRFFYALIHLGGRRLAYFFLYFIVAYYIIFRPSIRRKSYYYLERRFSDNTFLKMMFRSYRLSLELGKVLIDRAIIGILGYDKFKISFRQRETLRNLVKEGKGVIFLMAHGGCWQTALAALSYLNTRVNMVMRKEDGDVDRHYFEHQSGESPFSTIDPDGYLGGTLEMINVLKNGEVLCMMGDRVFGNLKNNVEAEFLGKKALFPFSAFKVASVTGAPLVVFFTSKQGADKFELDLADVIYVPENMGRSGEKFKPYVNRFVEHLEKYTEAHPFQFFNFYDMWEQL